MLSKYFLVNEGRKGGTAEQGYKFCSEDSRRISEHKSRP